MKKTFLNNAFPALGLILMCGGATTASAETLTEAMAAAYFNNPSLLAQRAALRATDEQVPQAFSGWLPDIDYTVSTGKQAIDINTAVNRRQHRDPFSQSLTLSQPLYSGGQTVAALNNAESTVMAERARLAATEQSVLVDTITAYLDYYRDKKILGLNVRNEEILNTQWSATKSRFEAGEITSTNVFQAEVRKVQATADRVKSEENLETSGAVYENVVGHAPMFLKLPPVPIGLPINREEAISKATKSNFNVIAANYSFQASTYDVDEKRGELLPSLGLEMSASRKLQASTQESRTDDYSALLTLTVPLYQAGNVYSELREARQTAAQQRRLVSKEKRDAKEEALRAWIALRSAQTRIKTFEAQAKAAKTSLEGIRKEAEYGTRSLKNVLDAEQEFLDAKINVVNVVRDELVASYELLSAIGLPLAEKLNLPAGLYDPQKHYDEVKGMLFGGASSGDITKFTKAAGAREMNQRKFDLAEKTQDSYPCLVASDGGAGEVAYTEKMEPPYLKVGPLNHPTRLQRSPSEIGDTLCFIHDGKTTASP